MEMECLKERFGYCEGIYLDDAMDDAAELEELSREKARLRILICWLLLALATVLWCGWLMC